MGKVCGGSGEGGWAAAWTMHWRKYCKACGGAGHDWGHDMPGGVYDMHGGQGMTGDHDWDHVTMTGTM